MYTLDFPQGRACVELKAACLLRRFRCYHRWRPGHNHPRTLSYRHQARPYNSGDCPPS